MDVPTFEKKMGRYYGNLGDPSYVVLKDMSEGKICGT